MEGAIVGTWKKSSIVGSAEGVGMPLITISGVLDGLCDGTRVGPKSIVMGAIKRSEGAVLGTSDGTGGSPEGFQVGYC